VTQLVSSNTNVVVEHLRSWRPSSVSQVIEHRGATTIVVPKDQLREIAQFCKESPKLQFNLLSDATCVDRFPIEPRFELNYQLVSIPLRQRICLRTAVSGQQPIIDSLMPVWTGANWLEREIFDLFGIRFEGHTDLRRILLPDEFKGAPLRRDFPVEGER
jgi:NADH-quinone oxidoreductase subunit C